MTIAQRIAESIRGDVASDEAARKACSRDTSLFERMPSLVVSPKDADDVAALVRLISSEKEHHPELSLTARAAGTDMSGGPLTDSIVVSFTKYMNKVLEVGKDSAVAQPGVYYRDFEKATLAAGAGLLPSYPASRELCAIGGIVANDSGGELTLRYGKTHEWVREIDVVLSDGSRATLRPLSRTELEEKKKQQDREGEIYRGMHALIEREHDEIERGKPDVSKNSAGYNLWDVYDRRAGRFDLTKLFVGSQGTLGLFTKARFGLVKPKTERAMLVVFLSDLDVLPEIVRRVMKLEPESFESYDDQTFRLAVRFLPQVLRHVGIWRAITLGFAFLPELWMVATGGVPKLILMAEFAEDDRDAAIDKVRDARHALEDLPVRTRLTHGGGSMKYWMVRRESFALLRKNLRGYYAAPFIDDLVVNPESYPDFLPELQALLQKYDLIYTIAGHIGNGNFHIIPLMDLSRPETRNVVLELGPKVYTLVSKYGGTTTGEHNDGIMRTPFLSAVFSERMISLFEEVKRIWDPQNIFNPGKKVGGTVADIERSMIKSTR